MKRSGTLTFVLFVVVALVAIFLAFQHHDRTGWGLVAVLAGILLLRVLLFLANLRQQRRNAEHGRGHVRIETRLGLEEDVERQIQHHHHQNPEKPADRDSAGGTGNAQ
jgi:apolipoprotein N-acyltransferase